MNRIINTLALATAGLVLLCGCSADPATDEAAPGGNDGKTVPVSFAAELPATRATIEIGDDRFNGAWEVDIDKLGIHATLNGVAQINKPFVFSSEGIFKGELTPGTGAWTYLAYYPHGEQSLNGTSATIPFGNTRIQKGGTYNSLFDILIAPAQTTANSAEGVDDSGERIRFNMQRLTSILDFDLTNSTSDPIRCVLLTAESDDFLSAKSLNFDLAQGEAAAPALDTEERSKSILINFDGGSASAAAQLDAFFNVLPGNYNLNLDIITATKQMASVKIDRTDKPFEAGVLYKKEVGTLTPSAIPAPSLDWPDQDIDATHEITVGPDQSLTYPAAIDITVPGGIAELKVEIVSDALNSLGIQNLDLVHETSIAGSIQYKDLGLKCSTEIQYTKSTVFDITKLVPMIAMLPDAIGNHVFKVSVTDLAGQTTVQDLTFHYGQVTLETADLWQNTATLKIVPSATAASATLEYKRSTDDAWQQATVSDNGNGTFTAAIEPTWSSSTNEMGKTVYEPDYATGVFAGTTYDYRLKLDGTEKETGRFTTAKGDVIPNADMSEWSTVSRAGLSGSKDVPYPNKTGDSFWDCGNNGITTGLCSSTTDKFGAAAPAAKLQSQNMLVLAAGNLFTGSFNYASMTGTVKFGSKYTYTARPKALRVKYHATTGDIDIVRSQNPAPGVAKGDPDKCRIFVAIVDWSQPHTVVSGTGSTTGAWDPANGADVVSEAGKVVGYGSMWIDQSTPGDALVSSEDALKIHWYEEKAPAPTGNYTIVISCAANAYGDYMTGYSKACLYVDDFEWVY